MPKTETTPERLNKGREMIQAFLDEFTGNDKQKAELGMKLWAIHDQGYHQALADNGMAPKNEWTEMKI